MPTPRMSNRTRYRPFVPMMILAAAVAAWLGFTTVQLQQERETLRVSGENLETRLKTATLVRTQLLNISDQLRVLRDQGNGNAAEILNKLEAQGINLPSGKAGPATVSPEPQAG